MLSPLTVLPKVSRESSDEFDELERKLGTFPCDC